MKVSELIGAELDYWVAKALADPRISMWGDSPWIEDGTGSSQGSTGRGFRPSTDWRDGGPIIERERICLSPPEHDTGENLEGDPGDMWWAQVQYRGDTTKPQIYGPTPLVAAMRAYVASKFGDEVDDANS